MEHQRRLLAGLRWHPVRAGAGRAPTEQELQALEHRLGGSLPLEYRRFLIHYGQSAFDESTVFPIGGDSPWGTWGILDRFYGFEAPGGDGFPDEVLEVFEGRLPGGTLPIALDPGGNLLLLAVGGELPHGSVWFWDHEGPTGGPVYPVAPSFSALLASLEERPRAET